MISTSSFSTSGSQAISASYAASASYALSSSYALSASYALSSSYAATASQALTSSYPINNITGYIYSVSPGMEAGPFTSSTNTRIPTKS